MPASAVPLHWVYFFIGCLIPDCYDTGVLGICDLQVLCAQLNKKKVLWNHFVYVLFIYDVYHYIHCTHMQITIQGCTDKTICTILHNNLETCKSNFDYIQFFSSCPEFRTWLLDMCIVLPIELDSSTRIIFIYLVF